MATGLAWFRTRRALLAILLVGAAPACPGPAAAQSAGTVDRLLETLQLKAHLAPAAPFVTDRSGQTGGGFIPACRTGAARAARPMTPAELATATADLDAARERQQRRAGRVPAAVPDKPAKPITASRR